jgi:uncharacterized protein (TIGR02996 family)
MVRHPDADAFMRKYLEQPADATARLVFADWLDETGIAHNAAWAAFIRLKAEAARFGAKCEERTRLTREADYHALNIRASLAVPARLVVAHWRELLELLPPPNITARLADFEVPQSVLELVPESVARENLVLPLAGQVRTLVCAAANPRDRDTHQKLEFILNRDIVMVGARTDEVLAAFDRHFPDPVEFVSTPLFITAFETTDSFYVLAPEPEEIDLSLIDPGAPVVRLVNLIIAEAVNLSADRILLFPDLDALAVRYRIDGEWVERDRIPTRLLRAITTRIALMALIIPVERVFSEPSRESPLRGSFTLTVHGTNIRVRVTIQPSPDGPTTQIDLAREPSAPA